MTQKRKKHRFRDHQLFTILPIVWKKLKKENKIDKAYRFRARKIERLHKLFYPAALLQKSLYAKKVNLTSLGSSPVFILGLWRSGTTHLHYMMARDQQFGYLKNHQAFTLNMSLLSFDKLNKILNIFVPGKRPQDNIKLTLDDPAEEEQPFSTMSSRSSLHSFFFPKNQSYFTKFHLFNDINESEKEGWAKDYIKLLKNIAFYSGKNNLLLKNPHNTGRVKELLELFPDARFIFIHRNPYDVFSSTKKLYRKMISTQFLQFFSIKEIEDLIIWQDKAILDKYLKERELIPKSNLYELAYEDLDKDPLNILKEIYTSLGLVGFEEASTEVKNYLSSVSDYKKNRHSKLSKANTELINEKWDLWFKEFGYNKR